MRKAFLFILFLTFSFSANAQMDSVLFTRSYEIKAEKVKTLGIEIDNESFFSDLEYSGEPVKGYTLPGFWLQPKVTYTPLSNLHLQLGAHSLFYWGATKYPTATFQGFPSASMSSGRSAVHVMPYFRANLQLGKSLHFVLGDIYGGQNHRLIEPLYNPELNLCADPEVGLQMIVDVPHWHFDLWADWQSFIFKNDNHQESFIVGASSDLRFGRFTIPLQVIFRHLGGEIQDSLHHSGVTTLINASLGLRYQQPIPLRWLRNLTFEADGLYYKQMSGSVYNVKNGYGIYASAIVDFIPGLRARVAYMKSHDFISLMGNAHYGCVSAFDEGIYYHNPQVVNFAVEYSRTLSKAFAFGARAQGFYYKPAEKTLGYSFGIFLKANPCFLIKQFK